MKLVFIGDIVGKEARETFEKHNGTEGGQLQYNFRLDAIKFCHKVFAYTELGIESDLDYMIFLDADVVFLNPFPIYFYFPRYFLYCNLQFYFVYP